MKKTRTFASALAASLAAVSLLFASPVNAAPNQSANEKTYRVGINSDAGAEFKIVKGQSDDGEVVDTFTSTDKPYYAELPVGTYTLVETQAPAGYQTADSQTFTVKKPNRWTDPTINNHYRATTAYGRVSGYYGSAYSYTVTRNVTTGQSANEVVYCVNSNKSSPAPNSDYLKRDGSADVLSDAVSTTTTRHRNSDDALRSKLMSIVYNGYPTNASGIQGSLSDKQFRAVTQLAVWDTVDQQNRSYAFTNRQMKNAYNALMQYKQNVPEHLEAHMYQISTDQNRKYQSLMGTAFGEIAAPMELTVNHVRVTKADVTFSKTAIEGTEELPGASLEIKQGDTVVESWTSTDTPHVFALEAGEYTMHEAIAPEKYELAEDITFRVTDDLKVQVKNGDEWVDAENSTVKMEDALTPVPYGAESPTPGDTEKPNLPNTGINKDVLAKTGAKLAFPLAFALIGLGASLVIRRKMLES